MSHIPNIHDVTMLQNYWEHWDVTIEKKMLKKEIGKKKDNQFRHFEGKKNASRLVTLIWR